MLAMPGGVISTTMKLQILEKEQDVSERAVEGHRKRAQRGGKCLHGEG